MTITEERVHNHQKSGRDSKLHQPQKGDVIAIRQDEKTEKMRGKTWRDEEVKEWNKKQDVKGRNA